MPPKPEKLTPGLKALVDYREENWLLSRVDAYLIQDKSNVRTDGGWFHPSDLSHPCDAFVCFQFLAAPKVQAEDARNRRILDHGHDRDRAWKGYLKGAGLSEVEEYGKSHKCEQCGGYAPDSRHLCILDLHVRGDCDDLIVNPWTGDHGVFEFKTKNEQLWKRLQAPDPDHVIQTHCYMVAKGRAWTMILYENSNDKAIKSFIIPFDERVWANVVQRMNELIYQMSHGIEPARRPHYCERCQYRQICPIADFPKLVDEYRAKKGLN